MANTYINRIATAVPPHDVHRAFLAFGHLMFRGDTRRATLFDRMAERSGIEHRYSYLAPEGDAEGTRERQVERAASAAGTPPRARRHRLGGACR